MKDTDTKKRNLNADSAYWQYDDKAIKRTEISKQGSPEKERIVGN